MSATGLRQCAYRWGVRNAGVVTLFLYGGRWFGGAGGETFVDVTLLLALVCLSPGCLFLGLFESSMGDLASASEMGVVLDADTRQRASVSLGWRLAPLGFFLTGVGLQGILVTALVHVNG